MHLQGTARTDERVLREARALIRAGYAVTIVDTDSDATRPRIETLDDITLRHITRPKRRFLPGKLGTAVGVFELLLRRMRALWSLPVDAYHAHDEDTLLAAYIAARFRRKPVILDAHELPGFSPHILARPVQRRLHMALLRRLLPGCRAVITVSPPIVDEIQLRYGGPRAEIVRNVPTYQPPIISNRLREHLQLPPETRIALYQGVLQGDRSLDVLVRAARFLPDDVVVVLMGSGPSKAALEALIVAEGLGERVRMVAAVPYSELLQWTASADLGLIIYPPNSSPNVRYCLPNKLFEYLMAGLPVLASSLDAVNDILETYRVGAMVRTLEPEEVGRVIGQLVGDVQQLAAMRQRALEASASDLRWENEQKRLIGLYQSVLGIEAGCSPSVPPTSARPTSTLAVSHDAGN
jgi:glycosyltransferase involved in cell wall biosynthesis